MPFVPQKKYVHNIPTMRWGMNNQQEPDEIQDFEFEDCENVSIEEDSIKSSHGYIHVGTQSEGPFWGIYHFKKSDGVERVIRQRGTTLEYDNNGTWTECTLPTSGSPAATIVLTQTQATFATLNDIVLFSNGTDDVMSSTDGITWTLRSSLPKGLIFPNAKNRIIFLVKETSALWWCDINTPLTVGANSWAYVDPNNNGIIVGGGLTPDGQTIINKERGTYTISDYVDSGIIDMNYVGASTCVSHHSIVTTENSVIWAGVDGFYEYIGGQIRKISGKIKWNKRNNCNKKHLTSGIFFNGKVRMSMPNTEISEDYNAQEYVIYKQVQRDDPTQPYAITRNKRLFGCYGVVDTTTAGVRTVKLYAGGSQSGTTGSPAVANAMYCQINENRDTGITQGLNGSAQEGYIISKFFTDNVPYYVKRYRKMFTNYRVENSTILSLGYRFVPYGSFIEEQVSNTPSGVDWEYDDGATGDFSEGYDFSGASLGESFVKIDNSEKPRGIQFRIKFNQVNDITVLGLAYEYKLKQKFK